MDINLEDFLKKHNACEPLLDWSKDIDDPRAAYATFSNGEHLCWLYMRTNPTHKNNLYKICIEIFDTIKSKFNDLELNDLYNNIIKYYNNEINSDEWVDVKKRAKKIIVLNRNNIVINIEKYYYTLGITSIIFDEFDKSLINISTVSCCLLSKDESEVKNTQNMLEYSNVFKKYISFDDFNII